MKKIVSETVNQLSHHNYASMSPTKASCENQLATWNYNKEHCVCYHSV